MDDKVSPSRARNFARLVRGMFGVTRHDAVSLARKLMSVRELGGGVALRALYASAGSSEGSRAELGCRPMETAGDGADEWRKLCRRWADTVDVRVCVEAPGRWSRSYGGVGEREVEARRSLIAHFRDHVQFRSDVLESSRGPRYFPLEDGRVVVVATHAGVVTVGLHCGIFEVEESS